MEYEYLEGVLAPGPANDSRTRVHICGLLTEARGSPTLNQLGMDRWRMCACVATLDDIRVFFQRQKLYPAGAYIDE